MQYPVLLSPILFFISHYSLYFCHIRLDPVVSPSPEDGKRADAQSGGVAPAAPSAPQQGSAAVPAAPQHDDGIRHDDSKFDDPFLGHDYYEDHDDHHDDHQSRVRERLMRRLRQERRSRKINPNPLREYLRNTDVEISPDILPPELRTPLTELTPLATCGKPSSVRLHRENFNSKKNFDREVLKAIIGNPSKYVDNEVDANHQSFACIDSRHQGPVLGTPGGDFGEFLVALSVMEDLIRYNFTESDVQQLLTQWVTWDKRGDITFFHSTDEDAVRNLARRLHVRGVANVLTDINIFNPPEELRQEMLLFLNQTQFQGSQIIRNLLDYPRKYQIRSDLTSAMIRSFYKVLWDKQTVMEDETPLFTKMHLEVYPEQAKPLAWVSVRSSANCEIAGSSHKVSPLAAIPKAYLTGAYKSMKIPTDWEKSVPSPVVNDEVAKALGIDTTIYDALGLPETHSFLELESDETPTLGEAPAIEMESAQVFIHHPHAVRQLRKWLSRFFALRFPLAASQPKILQLIERKQQSILESLAETVGRDVPFYTVTIE